MEFFQDFFAYYENFLASPEFKNTVQILFLTSPLWIPFGLAVLLWQKWLEYKREEIYNKFDLVLLEIRLPQEILRSPLAMELVLSGLHIMGGEGTWYDRYILGKSRAWFSLEIASIEGHIHFYVWTGRGNKDLVESQFYSQYPGIEMLEVPDYTDVYPKFDSTVIQLEGQEFALTQLDSYPIKTYVDYGLDKDPKEEFKYDPLTTVLEFMGSLGKGEQFWLQFIFRSHHGKAYDPKNWKKDTEKLIDKLSKQYRGEIDEHGKEIKEARFRFPTKGESDILASLHRSMEKLPYECGIRSIYIAPKEVFKRFRITMQRGLFKAFNSGTLNGFKSQNVTSKYDFPWEDFRGFRANILKRKMLQAYRRRSFFFSPYKRKTYILNAEELATLYHFPGQVSQTPLLSRLPSRKAEAPPNLPL